MAQGIRDIPISSIANPELAFIGDCVYALEIKTRLLESGVRGSMDLSSRSAMLLSAQAQSAALAGIAPMLDSDEADVVRRGRNAHRRSYPRSATPSEYRAASALECLFGWLYLTGRTQRIGEISDRIFADFS